MRGLAVLLVLLFAAGACGRAEARLLGDASVSYRAERTVTVDGRRYVGTVYHRPGQDRHEQEIGGMDEVVLLDAEATEGYLMLPGLKTYIAFRFPELLAELGDRRLLRAPLGHETINGVRTTKYRIDYTARDGAHARGFAWVSAQGVLMRLQGTVTRRGATRPVAIAMELSHLRVGPQDPGLFEVPPGLFKLPGGSLAPLLGGKTG